ncbi:hypothetical protein LTR86_005334 [Recurvomyces mirabilis]|nr:hypothetical protein LTR86_005334 [Recurvomyces mirabilis]
MSSFWYNRRQARSRGLKTLLEAHARLGPIIRLGPQEVSVVSEEGLSKIYAAGLDKSSWYQKTFFLYGVQNLVSTLDHSTHAKNRRIVARLYNKSYLQRCKNLASLSDHIVCFRLLPRLDFYSSNAKTVNVMRLFACTGVDMITGHIFGAAHSTDLLVDEAKGGEYIESCASGTMFKENYFEHIYRELLSPSGTQEELRVSPSAAETMYNGLASQRSAGYVVEREIFAESASEMLDHIIATQETNTIIWTYICYRLSLHPQLQDRLRSELRTLEPRITNEITNLPSPASLDKLSLLDAIVQETLRLHAANPARMPRVAPTGGMTLHGYDIPVGTIVSTNAYCLHRNPDVFPEPLEWRPERWMVHRPEEKLDGPDLPRMKKWFWAFGSGARNCIGQHFAIQTIKLVVAAIYATYTTHIVDDEGIEQSDSYNSGPIGGKLILRFEDVKDTTGY